MEKPSEQVKAWLDKSVDYSRGVTESFEFTLGLLDELWEEVERMRGDAARRGKPVEVPESISFFPQTFNEHIIIQKEGVGISADTFGIQTDWVRDRTSELDPSERADGVKLEIKLRATAEEAKFLEDACACCEYLRVVYRSVGYQGKIVDAATEGHHTVVTLTFMGIRMDGKTSRE